MTLEEAQAEIIKLQDQLKEKDTTITGLNNQIETHKTTIQTHVDSITEKDNKIDELRNLNNQYFLRIQQQPQETEKKQEEKKEPTPSTADVVNKLINN